ncbi:MAG: carbon-nitrogen hydrolase family protein [Clostridiales bacterium]|nr:carbon-nitrogen hydrolase family protein [Clostridiales bacterium]
MAIVSCVQMKPELGNIEYNVNKMENYIRDIMKDNPDTKLIVFPELITSGYEGEPELFQELAETLPSGYSLDRISALAREYQVNIIYGMPERDPLYPDVLYNAAVIIDSKGTPLGTYRKVHPFADEKRWCRAGCDFPVFETEIGRIGIMICWDTAFPEVARCLALNGAELLVVSTNWEDPYEEPWNPADGVNKHENDWDLMTRARAFDNTLHLVAANRIGGDGGVLTFFGRSKIIDPRGNVIEALDRREEGVISADLDLSLTRKHRETYYCFLKDRRPDAYKEVTRPY